MNPELQTPVPSPCISLCDMAPDTAAGKGLCRGCLRTLDEIVAWGTAPDEYKRAVWADIRRRESELDFD
ncbi:DUF1289 domain-containing protein [Massilia genomosp. 1]|uniref:DUF1289 domain-containing protein n=1 Tax=Massilia genomosp. 1 TaxID=2609280 RepID=A0ABX0MM32_9BURK|nr:DUF1289 domain-containing protein [Massilia genomosp. 1]NHZ63824.1 DUF1289 domain-containing protein [Massilia genomosp. 1]